MLAHGSEKGRADIHIATYCAPLSLFFSLFPRARATAYDNRLPVSATSPPTAAVADTAMSRPPLLLLLPLLLPAHI